MKKYAWLVPAAASVAFLIFSLRVMALEGPLGFLTEHTRNGWGVQIGIDLLSAATVALCFLAPAARRYNIRMLPWIVLTLLTGSIALFALFARILYAQHAQARAPEEPSPDKERGRAAAAAG